MKRDLEVKQQVLAMLKDFLMGEEGGKFKPKAVQVEVCADSPEAAKEGLDAVLEAASEDADDREVEESLEDKAMDRINAEKAGMSVKDWEGSEGDEEADEEMEEAYSKKPKKSFRDFFDR